LPPKYREWREAQIDGITFVRSSKRRVRGLAAPTGSGKTGLALALAVMKMRDRPGARTLILTETKPLQAIYAAEGAQMTPSDIVSSITGALNYDCPALEPGGRYDYMLAARGRAKVDVAPCNAGLPCKLRDRGCTYYGSDGALQQARDASIVITNYANWLSAADASEREEKFGEFDQIVMDEGHAAADAMCNALAVSLDLRDLTPFRGASANRDMAGWTRWASGVLTTAQGELDDVQAEMKSIRTGGSRVPVRLFEESRRLQRIVRALARIATARGEWVTVRSGTKVEFKPVWPDKYCESYLLRGVKDIVMMSATLVPQALRNIGLRDDQFDFMEMESTFPPERRPVYIFPCARMRYDMSVDEEQKMIDGLDAILKTRPRWRHLVHTVSYTRAQLIKQRSSQSRRITIHDSRDTARTIDWLKHDSPDDAVVATPSMYTGYDLPGDECRCQAIVKIPFPDTRDPVVKARVAKDKKYLYYAAMMYITQAVGRICRHDADYGETWILDSNALWFFDQAKEFMSKSLAAAVKRVSGIGRAPKV
jgi:Rad3-related DNA helicase